MKKKSSKISIGPIQKWGKEIEWEKRVRAVCKPCGEIKYCPYGPLSELLPLKELPDGQSCRIFGHDCPVFYCAEPLTETKELRNISRSIPRPVQFRVLKRENQICSECGESVKDEDVEFDHIIPWSKGGSSHENNVRLLCRQCNRKRGDRFEDKYLINSLSEHLRDPVPFKFIEVFFEVTKYVVSFRAEHDKMPTPQEFCRFFGRRKAKTEDTRSIELFTDMNNFFKAQRPVEFKAREFQTLKYRWGFSDGIFHKLKEASLQSGLDIERLLDLDVALIQRLGFHVKLNKDVKKKWLLK
jgi:5-methylcytosine-specific restriction endonuclease McrA